MPIEKGNVMSDRPELGAFVTLQLIPTRPAVNVGRRKAAAAARIDVVFMMAA